MRVSQLMIEDVATCCARDSLEDAAATMWDRDVGCLPVIDPTTRRVVGILTDRDICMSAYARNERLASLPVTLAMAHQVTTCRADDTIEEALCIMTRDRVRRVPVLDDLGRVIGVVSIDDIAAGCMRTAEIWPGEVIATLAAVARTGVVRRDQEDTIPGGLRALRRASADPAR